MVRPLREGVEALELTSKLTLAVNEDAPIDTIAELADNADLFDDRIVGIEPGAGLTAAMEEEVIPTYGLDDMEFLTSSTAAMLSELKSATDQDENIVVTLWEPHRAYAEYPHKNLEDPEGAFGDTESLYSYGSSDFSENSPTAAGWLEDFTMDSETLMSLVRSPSSPVRPAPPLFIGIERGVPIIGKRLVEHAPAALVHKLIEIFRGCGRCRKRIARPPRSSRGRRDT